MIALRDQEAFAAAMGRVGGCQSARRIASHIEEQLHARGYRGPVAIVGSYVRDIALARDPEVMTIYLDGPFTSSQDSADVIVAAIASTPGIPIPSHVDVVPLERTATVSKGYLPQLTNNGFNQETFLRAVTRLQPVRINALGATPSGVFADPQWDWDAYNNFMVMRYGLLHDEVSRPGEMTDTLIVSKYRGWTIKYEDASGELLSADPDTAHDSVLGH